MPTLLALDQGTTGSTAVVFDAGGRAVGRGYREITQSYPGPGLVEHDPGELVSATVAAARDALGAAGVAVDAVGITNQRETVVLWDRRTLQPVAPAIVWQDRRTAARCTELRQAGAERWIRQRTGLLCDPYFSATKVAWLLRDDALRRRATRGELAFGTVDAWLVARLSGGAVHATDMTNASRTLLVNLATAEWDDDLLALFGVPRELLAEIVPPAGPIAVAQSTFFGRELPITGVAGDQQAALFGQGCVEPGSAKITYGTGAFLLRFAGDDTPPVPGDGVLATIAAGAGGGRAWALEGSVFIAGAAVQWLRDGLGLITHAAETADLAASVPDAGGVSLVPAFTGLGAPYWNPMARGTITGLTRGTTRAHLVHATLDAIAQQTCDLVDAMGGITTLLVDGGAAANDWLMQRQADLLGVPVERPAGVEATAYGAARLAAVGIGASLPAARGVGRMTRFEPGRDDGWRAERRAEWRRAVAAALVWAGGSPHFSAPSPQ
jgi:glycerol kinase